MPDYDYTGKGVCICDTVPDSPAVKVGLMKGDIITQIGDTVIEDLYTFSEVLKSLQAGNEITIVFLRDNVEHSVSTEVVAR